MKLIHLTQGQVAIVDDEDFAWLSQWKWCAHYNKGMNGFYALRGVRVAGGRTAIFYMHRVILDAKKGEKVDHENHETLNNQRYNLRLTTHQGNLMNMRLSKRNTSGYCGVRWHKQNKKWQARITIKGKMFHLGIYTHKSDAISARQAANVTYGFHANHGRLIHKPNGQKK